MKSLTLIKLGGSLITDKTEPLTPRFETLSRLADEIAAGDASEPLLIGHGSGSFGHVTAAQHGLDRGVESPEQIAGVAATQVHAHRLHRLVVETLWKAGCKPFSIAPSSSAVAVEGSVESMEARPAAAALDLGLLPVTLGDVVMDVERGASICSTEAAFEALIPELRHLGWGVGRILWMGATEGIHDGEGVTVPEIDETNIESVLAGLDAPAGAAVTGGMRLRLETAWRLATGGIESLILNGLEPGRLSAALAGRSVAGTRVAAVDAENSR